MKKCLSLVLALCMLTALLPALAEEKTVITVTSAYALPAFEAGFEAAHPQVDLQVEVMATAIINGEVARRLRNHHGSDLIITNLPEGEIADYTYDLSAESFVESYQASIMRSVAIEGENRYLPLPGAYYGYIVNQKLLEQLGLAVPETRADLLNLLEQAKQQHIGVTPDTGYGFGFSDAGSTFLGAYFSAEFATDYLSSVDGIMWLSAFEEGSASFSGVWNSSIDFIKACIDRGYMDPSKIIVNYNGHLDTNSNAFKAETSLPQRTALLTFGSIATYEQIQSSTQDKILMLPCLPATGEGNRLLSAISNDYIAVNQALASDPAKLEGALSVLAYLSTEEGQALWIEDTDCYHSYLVGYTVDTSRLPESIRGYVESGMIFANPFPTNLLSYIGKNLTAAVKGSMDTEAALAAIDDYYLHGSEDVEYDLSVVGSVAADMLYINSNTRKQETELGNFISDAIREMTGADVALVNGGGIRSSLYKGDVTGDDLTCVCPYGNLVIVAEMDGATLRSALTNGIQKTWKPAGQFLQVSGIRYAYTPAADESETAVLLSLTWADGRELGDEERLTVAYTNYMGGSGGYVDAGDGFTMLNVYDPDTPVQVRLVSETGKTYRDALKEYLANHQNEEIQASLEGRIQVVP